ncbi:MAG: CBS domain-containing protein [Peptococcaceae bacterium]|jgi:CBS domain-containing protein/sporulation protein YlmC with PRC-barrel domain|nr:CBS domain-containing protein [Peptococcaceae bacterium]
MHQAIEFYLSQVLGKPVCDPAGKRLGRVRDVAIELGEQYPRVSGVRTGGSDELLPVDNPGYFDRRGVGLANRENEPRPLKENETWSRKILLDKQIVDTQGYKVVRVNDVKFARLNGDVRLVAVDIGLKGFLRRFGLDRLVRLTDNVLTWNYLEPLNLDSPHIRLTISQEKLHNLHPADLAEIVSDLDQHERSSLIKNLDDETVAEMLPDVDRDTQVNILENLDIERAADILEEMAPDEAADILGEMPRERSTELLSRMEPGEAEDVRELMAYEQGTAGALMTTEFISFPKELTAEETITRLRELAPDAEIIYYLYVVNESRQLVGVLSLRDLIIAEPSTPIEQIMRTRVVTVNVGDDYQAVQNLIAKYDLLAVPVVNDEKRLVGVIAVDDVINTLIPDRRNLESFSYFLVKRAIGRLGRR